MAGPPIKWKSDEEIIEIARTVQSKTALAAALGVHRNSLDNRLRAQGIDGKVTEAFIQRESMPRPIDDPERIKADQQAAELKALRKDNAEYAKRLASEEEFFDRIVEATRIKVKAPPYNTAHQPKGRPANSVVAPIYDQQFGQFVRPSDTPANQGEFNVDIFDKRLARYVDGLTGCMAKRASGYKLDELVLVFGGDHVEGDEIFAGQSWQLELDPPRQVWELAIKMDSAVREIVRFAREEVGISKVGIYGVTGNHGAVGGRRAGARPKTYNWDWLFLKILFDRLRAEPIDQLAIEPGGALFFRCAGHEFQAIHGDQIRGWGSLPFYGLTKFDGRSVRMHSLIYRYLLMGHHHQAGEIPNGAGETIASGDWVGANNLSGAIAAASRPQQKIVFVSAKWGIDATERIYFATADEAYEPSIVHEVAT